MMKKQDKITTNQDEFSIDQIRFDQNLELLAIVISVIMMIRLVCLVAEEIYKNNISNIGLIFLLIISVILELAFGKIIVDSIYDYRQAKKKKSKIEHKLAERKNKQN